MFQKHSTSVLVDPNGFLSVFRVSGGPPNHLVRISVDFEIFQKIEFSTLRLTFFKPELSGAATEVNFHRFSCQLISKMWALYPSEGLTTLVVSSLDSNAKICRADLQFKAWFLKKVVFCVTSVQKKQKQPKTA